MKKALMLLLLCGLSAIFGSSAWGQDFGLEPLAISNGRITFQGPDGTIRAVRVEEIGALQLTENQGLALSDRGSSPLRKAHAGRLDLAPITSLFSGTAESYKILSRAPLTELVAGIDLDSDSRREILIQQKDGAYVQPAQIFESAADDTFAITFDSATYEIWGLGGTGDADSDGLEEIISLGFDHGPWRPIIKVYEQSDPYTYPTALVEEIVGHHIYYASPPENAAIDDLDGDGIREIIMAETDPGYLSVYECRGDDTYEEVFLAEFYEYLLQYMVITPDLNGNGFKEALIGGVPYLALYETLGDDSYAPIWYAEADRNIDNMAYVGDSDGDGHKEFLVASMDAVFPGTYMHCTLYEYNGAGSFNVTWEISMVADPFSDSISVEAVDLDGDGRRELICNYRDGAAYIVDIYKAMGDDQYESIFSSAGETGEGLGLGGPIGVGDFDRDNKIELVLNESIGMDELATAVYETATEITDHTLHLSAMYHGSKMILDFTIAAPEPNPVFWYTGLLALSQPARALIPISVQTIQPISPCIDYPLSFPFPQIGWVVILSALITEHGVQAIDYQLVDTG